MKLHLCFDFDETLTRLHKLDDEDYTKDDIKFAEHLLAIMQKAIQDGHKISITTTREKYDTEIRQALAVIGLSQEEIEQVEIFGSQYENEGKNYHIDKAEEKHEISRADYFPILVEDSDLHCGTAVDAGIAAIFVDKENAAKLSTHLNVLDEALAAPDEFVEKFKSDPNILNKEKPKISTIKLPPIGGASNFRS